MVNFKIYKSIINHIQLLDPATVSISHHVAVVQTIITKINAKLKKTNNVFSKLNITEVNSTCQGKVLSENCCTLRKQAMNSFSWDL